MSSTTDHDTLLGRIDPELRAAMSALPTVDVADLPAARRVLDAAADLVRADLPALAERWGVDIQARTSPGGVGHVLFRPRVGDSPAPAVLWIHGGGFVVGSALLEAPFCAELAARTGAVVLSPDYRLAPEHPFPAALEDCYGLIRYIHQDSDALDLDPGRIAIGGQSAGGGLAVGTALLARDRGEIDLRFLAVESPELDDRLSTASMQEFTTTPVWRRKDAELSWAHYLGATGGPVSPYAAPARAEELRGLPPLYLSAAELDPLRDEGIHFASRVLEAGGSAEMHLYPGTFHRSSTLLDASVSRRHRDDFVAAVSWGLRNPRQPRAS